MGELETALDYALGHEGWYSNNPKDPGGETWRGIARRHWPNWAGWARIDVAKSQPNFPASLRQDSVLNTLVLAFYRENFWNTLYNDISNQAVATRLFDFGVNVSPNIATRAIQESANTIASSGLRVDGKFGTGTLRAVNAIEPESLIKEFRARKTVYYAAVGIRRLLKSLKDGGWLRAVPKAAIERAVDYATTFMLGWMRRAMS